MIPIARLSHGGPNLVRRENDETVDGRGHRILLGEALAQEQTGRQHGFKVTPMDIGQTGTFGEFPPALAFNFLLAIHRSVNSSAQRGELRKPRDEHSISESFCQ